MDINNMTSEEIIFSGVHKTPSVSEPMRSKLITTFTDVSLFKNEWQIFMLLLRDNPRILIDKDFLEIYMFQHKPQIARNPNINLSDFAFGSDDTFTAFFNSCATRLAETTSCMIKEEDFELAIAKFKMQYITEESIGVLEKGAQIMADGLTVGKRTLSGFNDMTNYVNQGLTRLSNTVNHTVKRGVIVYGMDDEQEVPLKRICGYGIETLDKALGGVYATDMISLLAPPKGGKSRFSAYVLHNAIIEGTSVVVWSIENGYKGIECILRARHFNYLYNASLTDVTKRTFISAEDIRTGRLTGKIKEMEEASWLDLKTNPKYGRIANIDDIFDADTFLAVLDKAVDTVNAELVCIDYLQLATSSNSSAPKHEIISQCYQKTLQYLGGKKIAGIFPAQLKQTFVTEMSKVNTSDLMDVELRTSAGESGEVIKTPSVNIMLYGTQKNIRDGELTLLSCPSRNSAPFDPIPLIAEFGTATFTPWSGVAEA